MKTTKYLIMAAVATAFAACSNDENVADGPVAAQVNAEIYNIVGTRASGTTWAATDEIGISVASSGLTTGTNVKYKKSENGFTSETPIYFQDLENVTFNAYYPYTEAGGTISKAITVKDQTAANQPKIDYMFARGATASKNTPAVNFKAISETEAGTSFQHCMSQLTFEFKAGTGVDDLSQLTQYTIKSLNMAGTFNTETGEAAANATNPDKQDLVFSLSGISENPHTAASVIIFPQGATNTTNNTFDIEITLAGQTYKATLALPIDTDSKFKAGYNLKYTVTINKTGLSVGSAEIFGWTTVTDTGTAEMQ